MSEVKKLENKNTIENIEDIFSYEQLYNSLTDNQKMMYNIEQDSEKSKFTIKEKANIVGISERAYYNFLNNKKYKALINFSIQNTLKVATFDVLQATLNNAIKGGDKGSADRKLLINLMKENAKKREIPPVIFIDDFINTSNTNITPTIEEYFNIHKEGLKR